MQRYTWAISQVHIYPVTLSRVITDSKGIKFSSSQGLILTAHLLSSPRIKKASLLKKCIKNIMSLLLKYSKAMASHTIYLQPLTAKIISKFRKRFSLLYRKMDSCSKSSASNGIRQVQTNFYLIDM